MRKILNVAQIKEYFLIEEDYQLVLDNNYTVYHDNNHLFMNKDASLLFLDNLKPETSFTTYVETDYLEIDLSEL